MVVDILLLHKEMAIVTIADDMTTLNKNVSIGKMTHKEVEAVEDLNSLIFIKEVVNKTILDRTNVITYFPCNKSWIV